MKIRGQISNFQHSANSFERGTFAFLAILVAVIFLFGPLGCTAYTSASGPQTQNRTGAGSGFLVVNSHSLSFGGVSKGSNARQSVTFTNTGGEPVNISQTAISGPGFALVGGSPSSIPAGQSATMTVQFSPQSTGPVTGTLSISADAANAPLTVPISGDGMQAGVAIAPASLNFGNVIVGQSGTQSVTLTNTGNVNLTINSATISGNSFSASGLSFPATIGAGQSVSLVVQFRPTGAGGVSGFVTLADNVPGSPQAVILAGSGVAANANLIANPGSAVFGSVSLGSSSTQGITIENSGTTPITISAANISGAGFTMSVLGAPQTINAGQSASFTAKFSPTSGGSASGTVSIVSNAQNSPLTIALTGIGAQGILNGNPSSFNFGSVPVGTNVSQTITVTNVGNASVTVSTVRVSGTGFSTGGLPAQTIGAGQSASFSAKFAPVSAGNASGSVTIASNASASPLTIPLSGTATQPQISVIPPSVSFANVVVGNTNSQTITVKNVGTANLTIADAVASGTGFGISGLNLQTPIPPGASITFNATFTPPSSGSASGSISLASNASNSPLVVSLGGTGITASHLLAANPTSLPFGSVSLGNTNSQAVTVTNTGNSDITIATVATSGTGFSASGIPANLTLSPSQSATLNVAFSPAAAGTTSGTVTISSNASAPTTISLSGTGTQPSHSVVLTWAASSSSGVTGYNVYRGSLMSGPYALVNASVAATTFTDTGAQSGQTYYYVVTAVGPGGVESTYSNPAAATIP
jgi:HYDIN/CFA65/VesB-like, Ig-like domain/Abnormal spindle-like microcephaly-assoc'd, ASPM-SPD-2-Hydin